MLFSENVILIMDYERNRQRERDDCSGNTALCTIVHRAVKRLVFRRVTPLYFKKLTNVKSEGIFRTNVCQKVCKLAQALGLYKICGQSNAVAGFRQTSKGKILCRYNFILIGWLFKPLYSCIRTRKRRMCRWSVVDVWGKKCGLKENIQALLTSVSVTGLAN